MIMETLSQIQKEINDFCLPDRGRFKIDIASNKGVDFIGDLPQFRSRPTATIRPDEFLYIKYIYYYVGSFLDWFIRLILIYVILISC